MFHFSHVTKLGDADAASLESTIPLSQLSALLQSLLLFGIHIFTGVGKVWAVGQILPAKGFCPAHGGSFSPAQPRYREQPGPWHVWLVLLPVGAWQGKGAAGRRA